MIVQMVHRVQTVIMGPLVFLTIGERPLVGFDCRPNLVFPPVQIVKRSKRETVPANHFTPNTEQTNEKETTPQ